jgi:adenine-specific DNA-methyltransferase
MKYMGSKRWMLKNGLGTLLSSESEHCDRFVDLFAGSGAVATYIAVKREVPCLAYDIQSFSTVLSGAVLARATTLDSETVWRSWLNRAKKTLGKVVSNTPRLTKQFTRAYVQECRAWSAVRRIRPITQAYGGHYFSPEQSLWIDALRATLPEEPSQRLAALSALIQAASQCAASPGHTAQPFQPTRSAKKFIEDAWKRSIPERTEAILILISKQFALSVGSAAVMDANEAAKGLNAKDLVFIDPPYSGVHYSRFYHVLETIARGTCSEVSGVGRYPLPEERPISKYSIGSKAPVALDQLLKTIAESGAKAILTFPSHQCSNGLSGKLVKETARQYFHVKEKIVKSKFSTLGGSGKTSKTGNTRSARQPAQELILVLSPKSV